MCRDRSSQVLPFRTNSACARSAFLSHKRMWFLLFLGKNPLVFLPFFLWMEPVALLFVSASSVCEMRSIEFLFVSFSCPRTLATFLSLHTVSCVACISPPLDRIRFCFRLLFTFPWIVSLYSLELFSPLQANPGQFLNVSSFFP